MTDPRPDEHFPAPPYRIGIVGGMGPMAGVYLQQLIIEATPAERDQDHFEVVCFTNPHVPERMRSLAEDGGRRYADAVRDSARLLVGAGATHIVIPCNTAHARLSEIQAGVGAPILDMVSLAIEALRKAHGAERQAGLLATVGTLNERVYESRSAGAVAGWVVPETGDQARVARAILAIKVGRAAQAAEELVDVGRRLVDRGATVLVIGCTEISMCHAALEKLGVPLVDPLRVVAGHLVKVGRQERL